MRIALGLKAHSGWAALVAIGTDGSELRVADRRRIELVDQADASWAKQPYHAAENLKPDEARTVVKRGIKAARQIAVREMRAELRRAREAGHEVAACGVLVGEPMPDWTTDEILAVHFRMHKAEGVLFRDVLVRAADACKVRVIEIQEKLLTEHAGKALAMSSDALMKKVATLGKCVGPPWGKDQKEAALAAMIALEGPHSIDYLRFPDL